MQRRDFLKTSVVATTIPAVMVDRPVDAADVEIPPLTLKKFNWADSHELEMQPQWTYNTYTLTLGGTEGRFVLREFYRDATVRPESTSQYCKIGPNGSCCNSWLGENTILIEQLIKFVADNEKEYFSMKRLLQLAPFKPKFPRAGLLVMAMADLSRPCFLAFTGKHDSGSPLYHALLQVRCLVDIAEFTLRSHRQFALKEFIKSWLCRIDHQQQQLNPLCEDYVSVLLYDQIHPELAKWYNNPLGIHNHLFLALENMLTFEFVKEVVDEYRQAKISLPEARTWTVVGIS